MVVNFLFYIIMGRRKKPRIFEQIAITGVADKGKAVGRNEEGIVIFVEKVIPGDVVDVLVKRKKAGYMHGMPVVFHKYSEDRVEAFCEHFGVCGGCKWQNVKYEAQLKHKEEVVRNALKRIGKVTPHIFLPILPAPEITYYRNKLEFSFSCKRWLTKEELDSGISNKEDVLGFHVPGAYDKIVNVNECHLQPEPSNVLRNAIKSISIEQRLDFYNINAHEGMMRNVIVRTSSLGEIMLVFSFKKEEKGKIKKFLDSLLEQFPKITSLHYCINPKVNDFILDLEIITYYGKGYIEEKLGDTRFKIGPKSFFQTNTKQAKRLYDLIVDFAGFEGHENVYDLYTGTGSIALYISRYCRQVVGVEEIAAAIEDAKFNQTLNEIDNTVFYAGDVKDILTENFANQHGKPDIVITDPPRAGMHPKAVDILLKLAAPKIVYVSCNPATQARDIQLLQEKYELIKVQPVDMFPHTHHIENIALLHLKKE